MSKSMEQMVRDAQREAGKGEAWEYGLPAVMQGLIDSGEAWKLEGSCGRTAMQYLEAGVCFLPTERHRDYWGSTVPSRDDLKPGTKGTLENAARHYGLTQAEA
jgi:hypothetical protein